jgi:HK97 family phage portal protein
LHLTLWGERARNTLNPFRKSVVETKAGLASPEAWLINLFAASPAASGVTVTPRTAMQCAPVRCAVQAIAETVGQLPLHVYQRATDGSKERDSEHPAYPLLHDAANDWTPSAKFREEVTRDALLYPAVGFAFINRVDGKPVELIRLDPEQTPVTVGSNNSEPVYQVSERGKPPRIIARQDIIHIPSPSLSGCGLLQDGREAIGLAVVMERHAATLFGNGGRPDGLLKTDNKLGPEAATRIGAAWRARFGGGQSGGTPVLEQGLEFQPITFSSVDAQFIELRKFSIEEIARLFRVPPVFLMEYGRATWANSESMRRDFIDFSIRRWLSAWEGEIALKLFTADERKSYFTEFLLDDFVKGDLATRMEAYSKAIAARILNPNEVRALENRPPYVGGDVFANPNTSVAVAA